MFSDLFKIIKENWTLFDDVFGSEKQLESYKQFVINARNSFKHSNETSNVDLASAEAGLLWFEKCMKHAEIDDSEAVLEAV